MSRHSKPFTAIAALALLLVVAENSFAQQQGRGRGFGRGFNVSQPQLASLEQVQTELKVTAEQKSKITEANETLSSKRRELFQGGNQGNQDNRADRREQLERATAEATEQVRAALDETQQKRLREIWIQVNGTAVLDEEPISKELKITEQQRDQIAEARREAFEGALQNFRDLSAEERREKFQEARSEAEKKALAALTAEQRQQFEKMQGEKIEIDIRQLFQRRRDT